MKKRNCFYMFVLSLFFVCGSNLLAILRGRNKIIIKNKTDKNLQIEIKHLKSCRNLPKEKVISIAPDKSELISTFTHCRVGALKVSVVDENGVVTLIKNISVSQLGVKRFDRNGNLRIRVSEDENGVYKVFFPTKKMKNPSLRSKSKIGKWV